jgi:hypothetical protein
VHVAFILLNPQLHKSISTSSFHSFSSSGTFSHFYIFGRKKMKVEEEEEE